VTDSRLALDMLTKRKGGGGGCSTRHTQRDGKDREGSLDGKALVVIRPQQGNRRSRPYSEQSQRNPRGVSGRSSPHRRENDHEGGDKGGHGEVATRVGPRRQRKSDA
jgi:hypothetical protein